MVYYYLFGHSCSMDAAEIGGNHRKFSVSINLWLVNSMALNNNNESYTELLDGSVLCQERSETKYVEFAVDSLENSRPGGRAGGCNTNNSCTRVHAALNGQVSCLSCIFNMGQYSSLDCNDLCILCTTNNATCPPSGLNPMNVSSEQCTHHHEPYGQNSYFSCFSLSLNFSYYYRMDEGGGGGGGGEKPHYKVALE